MNITIKDIKRLCTTYLEYVEIHKNKEIIWYGLSNEIPSDLEDLEVNIIGASRYDNSFGAVLKIYA